VWVMRDYNYITGYLTRSEKAASLLLLGVLSAVLELSEEKCSMDYRSISTALKKRKSAGRTHIYADLSWNELLQTISRLALALNPEYFADERVSSGWLGNKAATEIQITTAENRLGRALPADYRDFLKASNGFQSYTYARPSLLPVEEIGWVSQLDENLEDFIDQILEMEQAKYPNISKTCLIVGGLHDEEQVLLFPTHDDAWICWSLHLAGGCGEIGYQDFRYYMEDQLATQERDFYS
jgi:hypothetical protein